MPTIISHVRWCSLMLLVMHVIIANEFELKHSFGSHPKVPVFLSLPLRPNRNHLYLRSPSAEEMHYSCNWTPHASHKNASIVCGIKSRESNWIISGRTNFVFTMVAETASETRSPFPPTPNGFCGTKLMGWMHRRCCRKSGIGFLSSSDERWRVWFLALPHELLDTKEIRKRIPKSTTRKWICSSPIVAAATHSHLATGAQMMMLMNLRRFIFFCVGQQDRWMDSMCAYVLHCFAAPGNGNPSENDFG